MNRLLVQDTAAMDCHVESHRESDGRWRAAVVHTASGTVRYVTWPYGDELAAVRRARRWLRDEYAAATEAMLPLDGLRPQTSDFRNSDQTMANGPQRRRG